jgi:TolB protein
MIHRLAAIACVMAASLALAQEQPAKEPLSDIVQLTSGFSRAGEAYFSPDQKWIIFQGVPQGQEHYQMYLEHLKWDGDKIAGAEPPIHVSPKDSRNTCGFFSPDGKTLLFASTAGKEKPDEPTGGYQREGRNYRWEFPTGMEVFKFDDWQKAIEGKTEVDLAKHPLTDNNVYDAECSFSPDGKWIVYTHGSGAEADIYVMRSDGSKETRLTTAKGYDGGPFFSPDGKRMLYRSDRKGNDLLQIFVSDLVFDAAGNITGMSNEKQLTDDANVNWGPYFHPDGHHIIFATSRHGHTNYELYMIRDDGSHATRITNHEGADVLPVFSPDGKYLMWTSKRTADNTTQVFAGKFHMPVD